MSQPSLAKTFVKGLFSLEGRMTRSDFWFTTIALTMAAIVFTVALNSFIRLLDPGVGARVIFVVLLIQLLIAWPGYAISVKRGHDRNYSGWRTLWLNVISHLVPIGLIVVPLFLHTRPQWQGAFWVFAVLTIYMTVDYGILDGTPGDNRYGPSPKGIIRV